MTYNQAPSGVQEKHFPLPSLHSASGKLVNYPCSCYMVLLQWNLTLPTWAPGATPVSAGSSAQ